MKIARFTYTRADTKNTIFFFSCKKNYNTGPDRQKLRRFYLKSTLDECITLKLRTYANRYVRILRSIGSMKLFANFRTSVLERIPDVIYFWFRTELQYFQ